MVYYTGDIHGDISRIKQFCYSNRLYSCDDIVVILGDAGINFYQDSRDDRKKYQLNRIGVTVFCIHGNHEIRPNTLSSYQSKQWLGGTVWYEEAYPNILFGTDGDIYSIGGLSHLVIGGAYSVDKYIRLQNGNYWWADEQPSEEIKRYVELQINQHPSVDVVLSHTCPYKYCPPSKLDKFYDGTIIDNSTEIWLDTIEHNLDYRYWLCGHWHIDHKVDRIQFLYKTVCTL